MKVELSQEQIDLLKQALVGSLPYDTPHGLVLSTQNALKGFIVVPDRIINRYEPQVKVDDIAVDPLADMADLPVHSSPKAGVSKKIREILDKLDPLPKPVDLKQLLPDLSISTLTNQISRYRTMYRKT